ncbi:MAG: polysaccharide deacetylase family protein, partial [Nanoarchaeota archaeon]|nr:polysaccharide deacetylase family protein [Nanoarchaeota archaeon]
MKYCFLTFDIEEFDLPFDYRSSIKEEDSFELSRIGTKIIINILKKHNIQATFFVTATFAQKYPDLIKELSEVGEIACHGYSHKDKYTDDKIAFKRIKDAKKELEKISLKEVIGFRGPKLKSPKSRILKDLGFLYNSTSNPVFFPGYYNNLSESRKIYKKEGLIIFPISATPITRTSLCWYFVRNFGLIYAKTCSNLVLFDVNYLNLIFHPWEFISLKKFDIPFGVKNNTGKKMI